MKGFFIFLFTFITLSVVTAQVNIGENINGETIAGVSILNPSIKSTFNNNTANVNHSVTTDIWLASECPNGKCDNVVDTTGYLGTLFVNLTGDSMTGRLNITNGANSPLSLSTTGARNLELIYDGVVRNYGCELFGAFWGFCFPVGSNAFFGTPDVTSYMLVDNAGGVTDFNNVNDYTFFLSFVEKLRITPLETFISNNINLNKNNLTNVSYATDEFQNTLKLVTHNHDPEINGTSAGSIIPHNYTELTGLAFDTKYQNNHSRPIIIQISATARSSFDGDKMIGTLKKGLVAPTTIIHSCGIAYGIGTISTHSVCFGVIQPSEYWTINKTISRSGSINLEKVWETIL